MPVASWPITTAGWGPGPDGRYSRPGASAWPDRTVTASGVTVSTSGSATAARSGPGAVEVGVHAPHAVLPRDLAGPRDLPAPGDVEDGAALGARRLLHDDVALHTGQVGQEGQPVLGPDGLVAAPVHDRRRRGRHLHERLELAVDVVL